VKLEVVGACSQARRAAFERIIESLGIAQRVEFTGQVTRERLPGVLAAATVLVLPRRAGLFSDAGFPTKLGEYLASGTPVVTTDTGEIGRHLTDGVTAYVVRPGDPSAFAAAVAHVLDEPDEAAQVGARGQTLAASEFDLRGHGERLAAYLRGLSER
jgi:glycosyltransferase involved in cell wall biosynthesis